MGGASGRKMRWPVSSLLGGVMLVSAGAGVTLSPGGALPVRSSAMPASRIAAARAASSAKRAARSGTVWLCRPGMADDPCASSLATTVVQASGAHSVVTAEPDTGSKFDCFYVYPTVSGESSLNADLRVQKAETDVAIAQASRFSTVCRVWAPMYRQVTLVGLVSGGIDSTSPSVVIAYDSIRAGFEDYLEHFNDGRPIIFIGHSQGAAMTIMLLQHFVDNDASLRRRLVLALILGGNVVVRTGSLTGGSFSHLHACTRAGGDGCVIAYSSFPGKPPAASFFARPGQGVSLMSGQTGRRGLQVVCTNPADLGGGSAPLEPFFPSEGLEPTPWVEFPGLYSGACESESGATWLEVAKSSGASDHRPVVTETDGPDWGFHPYDVNLALGNLVTDVAAAEASWSRDHRK